MKEKCGAPDSKLIRVYTIHNTSKSEVQLMGTFIKKDLPTLYLYPYKGTFDEGIAGYLLQ